MSANVAAGAKGAEDSPRNLGRASQNTTPVEVGKDPRFKEPSKNAGRRLGAGTLCALCSISYSILGIPFYYGRQENATEGKPYVYNADLVRQLCCEISAEKDPEKTHVLLLLLRAVMKEDVEEIRIRMAF